MYGFQACGHASELGTLDVTGVGGNAFPFSVNWYIQ